MNRIVSILVQYLLIQEQQTINLAAGCLGFIVVMTGHGILDFVNNARHDVW